MMQNFPGIDNGIPLSKKNLTGYPERNISCKNQPETEEIYYG